MRICTLCGESKPLEEFHREHIGRRHTRCRDCKNAIKRARSVEAKAAERRRHRAAHPEKRAATRSVWKAVRAGRLIRADACERCGVAGAVEAHHADYAKQLEVEWLCKRCHNDEHIRLRELVRDAS